MNARLDEIASWRPAPSGGLESAANEYGYPTVIHRTPSRLVEECEIAFDAGLLLAALNLVVTIPDVCAKAVGMKYTDWCVKYLDLPISNHLFYIPNIKAPQLVGQIEKSVTAW